MWLKFIRQNFRSLAFATGITLPHAHMRYYEQEQPPWHLIGCEIRGAYVLWRHVAWFVILTQAVPPPSKDLAMPSRAYCSQISSLAR